MQTGLGLTSCHALPFRALGDLTVSLFPFITPVFRQAVLVSARPGPVPNAVAETCRSNAAGMARNLLYNLSIAASSLLKKEKGAS